MMPKFEQWLREATFANIYRHALDLTEDMDASLRRRVKGEIMSAARNDYSSRSGHYRRYFPRQRCGLKVH